MRGLLPLMWVAVLGGCGVVAALPKELEESAPRMMVSASSRLLPLPASRTAVKPTPATRSKRGTGFEKARAGRIGTLETNLGTWTSISGRSIVDNKHAKTGNNCLQLTGGEKTSVILEFDDGAETVGDLSFWAERWTKRSPFSFRIEKQVGTGWKEIFNGDSKVRVGRSFLSHVRVHLGDTSTRRLRFTVTSPPNTGILIDDIRIVPARPNILLIVGEDHGCELSCYGDPVVQTPNIDRLAAEGVLFESGYVTQSVCSPSRSTIFTGLYPHQNGQLGLATHQYGWFRQWPTTYSLLKNAGYRTGLIGKTHVIPADAVESFVDFRFQKSSNFSKKNVTSYATEAGEFFRASDAPFFLTVNYPDAHWPLQGQVDGLPGVRVDPKKIRVMPYVGGDTPRLRGIVRNYYDCMLRLDACVGQLLKQLHETGKTNNTLVVFIGDHGAQMARGKVTAYEGGMRVPYIVRWPGVARPEHRSKALVSTIDLLPTFMDAAGIRGPAGLPGQSLRPLLGGSGAGEFREYLACERNCDAARHTFPQRTIRDTRYKLIYSPVRDREDPAARFYRSHGSPHWSGCLTDKELAGASEQTRAGYARWLNPPEIQLFDLQGDPHEWNDLSDDPRFAKTKARLFDALKQWQVETDDPLADPDRLAMLMKENDAVARAGRRSPEGGWQYLKYLAPNRPQVIFQQRNIPAGVPRKGHSRDATTYGYRIPSLLVTQEGSILAFSERRLGLHDHAQNDIVLRRSTDDGKTWSDEIVAHEDGMNSINDPLTVQLENGRILLMFARFPYGRHARDAGGIKMADLGYDDPKSNVLTLICHSDDDGRTWSKPVDVSRQVKAPHLLNANTPGAMIQLSRGEHKGRIVTGLWGALPTMSNGRRSREWQVVVVYSDDNGKTWRRTEPLKDESGRGFPNECQVAEAANGDLVLISRNQGGDRFRKKAISRDGGNTWGPFDVDRGLPSVACMGAVIKGPVRADGTWDLWASFPSSAGRRDGQIAVSSDNGRTWRIVKVIHGPFAYSALQVSPDRLNLLCFYESAGYRSETLIRIPFNRLRGPAIGSR